MSDSKNKPGAMAGPISHTGPMLLAAALVIGKVSSAGASIGGLVGPRIDDGPALPSAGR